MEVAIIDRPVRRDGTPPRCTVCRRVCEPALVGPVLCQRHTPQQQGATTRARKAVAAPASPRTTTIPAPVPFGPAPAGTPRTYRERLMERLRARGLA